MTRPQDPTGTPGDAQIDARIDVQSEQQLEQWARKLDASEAQIKEAVQAVGPRASDVEEHLKGSRSTTNSERTRQALKSSGDRLG